MLLRYLYKRFTSMRPKRKSVSFKLLHIAMFDIVLAPALLRKSSEVLSINNEIMVFIILYT